MENIRIPKTPLFRDPIHDGAADPVIVWNRTEKNWWIFYTNRRANAPDTGFAWIHGTDIGIVSSDDGGQTWLYRGIARGLEFEKGRNTFWAPEIIWHDGTYHMYCSYVRGIPETWEWGRNIIHYTSADLWDWQFQSILTLASDRVIDACVNKMLNGNWRLWYKNERDNGYTYAADSKDLYHWQDVGPVITDRSHEGPNVFYWKDQYFMIVDHWKGLGVYSSDDGEAWERKSDILNKPGLRKDDGAYGHHADVLVQNDHAYIFYFTHPGITEAETVTCGYNSNRTSLQVAMLEYENGEIVCDRNKAFDFKLVPEG
jgi:hypothetical protein